MLLRSAIIASVLLGSSLAAAEPAIVPVKALNKPRPSPKKKHAVRAHSSSSQQPALASNDLTLSDSKPSEPPPPPPPAEPAPSSPSLEVSNKDKVLEPKGAGPERRFSVELNPLAIAAGRYGMNVEYVPYVHHALIASAFYQTFPNYVLAPVMPTPKDKNAGASGKVGGELGYRYYTGHRGANGFFAGASGVIMPLATPRYTQELKGELTSFYAYGGAIDLGFQAITDFGLTIGGGIGGMYLAYNVPESAPHPSGEKAFKVTEAHVLPRVLLSAGWSF